MAPVLKTGMGKLIVGSNPTPSARSQAAETPAYLDKHRSAGRASALSLVRSHREPLDLARRDHSATTGTNPEIERGTGLARFMTAK
jgi:hypothetical protein